MAKKLIPEELDALIQEYLTDGVLTDKERSVILKKAEGLGFDRDEIDLYLDAQIQKIDQAADAAARRQKSKTCPYCGTSVPQITDKCPECGQFITPEASEDLQEIIDNLEEALVDMKTGEDVSRSKAIVERYARKARLYYGNHPKIKLLLEDIETETFFTEKKVKSDARNKQILSIIKDNSKVLGTITFIVVVAIIIGIVTVVKGPDPHNDSDDCIKCVKEALEKGDVEMAAFYCKDYADQGWYYGDKIKLAFILTSQAYLKEGNYDKALSLIHERKYSDLDDLEMEVRRDVADKLIADGKYDEAEKYTILWSIDSYNEFLQRCIDHMKSIGDDSKIKDFITKKTINNKDFDKKELKDLRLQLYKYADIKY